MQPSMLLVLVAFQPGAEPQPGLRLADAGRTDYVILVHRDAAPPERPAAEELARFLRQVTGATFPVKEVTGPPKDPGPAILVGPGAAGGIIPAREVAGLGKEGYVLRTRGAALAIVGGRPRGTLYGAYSFLEDSLGCRWFTPEVSRIPKTARVVLRPLNRTVVPRLEY